MINNSKEFRKRFETYFIKNGLKLSEILYSPVTYLDKCNAFLVGGSESNELFT